MRPLQASIMLAVSGLLVAPGASAQTRAGDMFADITRDETPIEIVTTAGVGADICGSFEPGAISRLSGQFRRRGEICAHGFGLGH
jgi:hypothetical protein